MPPKYYLKTINNLKQQKIISTKDTILIVAGGEVDKKIFLEGGFQNIIISNLDTRLHADKFHPFTWSFQNAENLTYDDESFDFCIIHQGIHHCQIPAKALTELYRVAKKGVVMFEPYDNLLTKTGLKLGIGQEYETAAVFNNDLKYGGMNNTEIPNYIYRWRKNEIYKTIKTYNPAYNHKFIFVHDLEIPWEQLKLRKTKTYYYAAILAIPFIKLTMFLFPSQGNIFAAIILKPNKEKDLMPWLMLEEGSIVSHRKWFTKKYTQRNHI